MIPLTQISAGSREPVHKGHQSGRRRPVQCTPATPPFPVFEDDMSSFSAFVSVAQEIETVRDLCDRAPAGLGKDAARLHLGEAEVAMREHRDADCLRSLSAAVAALE